ncbi:RNA polymerase II elongation factor [Golovinomyces cichoracearum]|uniref:RNA polymerase II elongation factor n=1 Tax=Golovinomyces cichoracearum TaxID=62708 RepID=A0A420HBD0_9PEZI|nr:RNA polymerase II elongation factor [Golovinomyces cichoracearum]
MEFSATLQSDFKDIRALATCSICDQLLYEPWTIACGHTYCYSCLCSWFSQNKRKKSCPECRSKVKTMPAPSFLIKQVVELIIKRSELMPADETIEQHQKRKAEEMSLFDCDKTSAKGIFKGMFSVKQNKLWRDNSDGVLRCSGCGFEHEGGPLCTNCGEQINEEDDDDDEHMEDSRRINMDIDSVVFDLDADEEEDEYVEGDGRNDVEVDSMGFDPYAESDEDGSFNFNNYHHFQQHIASYIDMAYPRRPEINYASDHFGLNRDSSDVNIMEGSDSEDSELSETYDSSSDINDDGDTSLEGFIIPDDEEDGQEDDESNSSGSFHNQNNYQSSTSRQQHTITISDDGSDEGGEISSRRQIRRRDITHQPVIDIPSSLSSVDTFNGISSNESESGVQNSEIRPLKFSEWNSSDQEIEVDEDNGNFPPSNRYGHSSDHDIEVDEDNGIFPPSNRYDHSFNADDESHTNTTNSGGNYVSVDDDCSQDGRRSSSEISNNATCNTRNCTNLYNVSESSKPKSDKRLLDQSISVSWDRHPNNDRTSPFTDEENEDQEIKTRSRQNVPYLFRNGETSLRTSLGVDRTRRKRPARESSILDAEAEVENRNFSSRRSKAWAISRMRHNHQGYEINSTDESSNHINFQPESTGLANVVRAVDEESDDSIQPPSRRHLRHQNSNGRAERCPTGICSTFSRPQIVFGNSHTEGSIMNQPTSRKLQSGLAFQKNTARRTKAEIYLPDLPKNSISYFVTDSNKSNLIARTSRNHHTRIQI